MIFDLIAQCMHNVAHTWRQSMLSVPIHGAEFRSKTVILFFCYTNCHAAGIVQNDQPCTIYIRPRDWCHHGGPIVCPWNPSNITSLRYRGAWSCLRLQGVRLSRVVWLLCNLNIWYWLITGQNRCLKRWTYTQRNLIKSDRNQIVFTIFRLNQTDVRLIQSGNGEYNLISVWYNKISRRFLFVYVSED